MPFDKPHAGKGFALIPAYLAIISDGSRNGIRLDETGGRREAGASRLAFVRVWARVKRSYV
jgi:hypothetical protein